MSRNAPPKGTAAHIRTTFLSRFEPITAAVLFSGTVSRNFLKMTRPIIAFVLSFDNLMMAALDEAFLRASSTFKISGFNSYQKLAIEKFVIQKQYVLVNLPTGSGKSLIYQALPIVFDSIFKEQGHLKVT